MNNKYIIATCIVIMGCLLFTPGRGIPENYETNTTIHVNNIYHLGDNIFNLRLFAYISEELKRKNITIKYALEPDQIPVMKEWIQNSHVELIPLKDKQADSYDMWMGYENISLFDDAILSMYRKFLSKFNLITTIPDMYLSDDALLTTYDKLNNKYKNVDVLVINGEGRSGQCDNDINKQEWPDACKYLHSKYKIVTTEKMEGIACTRDDNLTLKDIAAMSMHVKYIVAVHTGPLTGCYNAFSKQNVKKWIIIRKYPISHSQINAVNIMSPKEIKNHL
jgi:hypothetical protein